MWHWVSPYTGSTGGKSDGICRFSGTHPPEETGTHGVVYGEITEDEQGQYHTQITLVPCACRSYIPLSLRIHSGTTQAALEQKVQDAIAQKGSEDIYWLRIQGYRNPELEFELEALRAYGNIVKITDEIPARAMI